MPNVRFELHPRAHVSGVAESRELPIQATLNLQTPRGGGHSNATWLLKCTLGGGHLSNTTIDVASDKAPLKEASAKLMVIIAEKLRLPVHSLQFYKVVGGWQKR